MNIVLIVFDSLRKDCVGFYGCPPWGKVHTPHLDAFASESIVFRCAYPESLPTLPARRALYTGRRVYPFHQGDIRLKGDFVGAPGWGPIPEDQPTLAEMLSEQSYRTALISDVYHMFKPSKNFWRGFDQWTFLRGQEADPYRSGPRLSQEEIDHWLPKKLQKKPGVIRFMQHCITNVRQRELEEDMFSPRVFREAANWLQQNTDAGQFFLAVESFDPHEPWLVPDYYRRTYLAEDGPQQVRSIYGDGSKLSKYELRRTRANYSASVTQCDRWFGFFLEQMKVMGLLDNSLIIVTSDHGHSMADSDYIGKSGYPSRPEVYDVPLMIRLPKARHAGKSSRMFVQHHDICAEILKQAKFTPPSPIDGKAFVGRSLSGKSPIRDHVTVGWGSTPTVITRRWWFNCKCDGSGLLLHDLKSPKPFTRNLAAKHPKVARELFKLALADAKGGFPDWLVRLATTQSDAPGCSDLAARR